MNKLNAKIWNDVTSIIYYNNMSLEFYMKCLEAYSFWTLCISTVYINCRIVLMRTPHIINIENKIVYIFILNSIRSAFFILFHSRFHFCCCCYWQVYFFGTKLPAFDGNQEMGVSSVFLATTTKFSHQSANILKSFILMPLNLIYMV